MGREEGEGGEDRRGMRGWRRGKGRREKGGREEGKKEWTNVYLLTC